MEKKKNEHRGRDLKGMSVMMDESGDMHYDCLLFRGSDGEQDWGQL